MRGVYLTSTPLYFSLVSTRAAPLDLFGELDVLRPRDQLPLPTCDCPADQRTVFTIVQNCIVTIALCTWSSVHPNIPGRDEGWWEVTRRRIELMLWGLIAPEFILIWAMRQWRGARHITQKVHELCDVRWTMTHGHFVQMGGFTLMDGDVNKGVLAAEKFQELLKAKKIHLPTITEEEINDRSKGDGLSATLTVVQTTWFIIQFFLRLREYKGLAITHIEWLTVAVAIFNGALHFLWWRKPLNAQFPIPLALRLDASNPVQDAELPSAPHDGQDMETKETLDKPDQAISGSERKDYQKGSRITRGFTKLTSFISNPLKALTRRLGEITALNHVVKEGATRVPTFYGAEIDSNSRMHWQWIIAILFSIIFGVIHFLAFFVSTFPTETEGYVWLFSSFFTLLPIPNLLSFVYIQHQHGRQMLIARISTLLGIYILARVILFVLGFTTLRGLPPAALDNIHFNHIFTDN